MSILDAALDYVSRGLPVFPVNPTDKAPFTANGFKNATTDKQKIHRWWRQHPNAMIGVPTGPSSRLWILDADVDPGKKINGPATLARLTSCHGPLPPTLASLTPRGGKHFIWRWNGAAIRNSAGEIGRGLDVRGEGGYVCLPPSKRSDGVGYRWEQNGVSEPVEAPAWLVDLAVNATGKKVGKAWARAALRNECEDVAREPAGKRNDRLNKASFNLHQIVYGGALDEQLVRDWLFDAAEACGLVADDGAAKAWATIDSGAAAARGQPRTRPGTQHARQQGTLPKIRLVDGELPAIVDQAEQALLASGLEFYQRGDLIVRPALSKLKAANDRQTLGWRVLPVDRAHMVEALTRVASFEKMDARAGAFVAKDCPDRIAETYLARAGHWRTPVLTGIVTAPFLRLDGSICDQPGYDAASGLLLRLDQTFPGIAEKPTKADAEEALLVLDVLIDEFPFVTRIDRAVALAAFLTAFDRQSLSTAPLFGFTSPVAGSGKSLLIDAIAILTSGQLAPVISQGRNEEELEKRLGAALIAGDPLISIDNCDHVLASSFLCQALTQQRLKIRLLGHSRYVETPINATIFATGNNLTIASDLTRRTLLCAIDAGVEQPELRTFNANLLELIRAERARLVAASLTILRAWHLANAVLPIPSFGSLEDWSRRIREPLIWLGQEDPCKSIQIVRKKDPERTALVAVIEQWRLTLGTTNAHTVQQVINAAANVSDFLTALTAVAATTPGGTIISNVRLGRWLRRVEGKIVNKLKLKQAGVRGGYPLWQLIAI